MRPRQDLDLDVTPPRPRPREPPATLSTPLRVAGSCVARTRHPPQCGEAEAGAGDRAQGEPELRPDARDPLTMDGEIEVAAVEFVLGGHLTAVASGKVGLGICDVQLEQVDLWGQGVWGAGAGRRGPSPMQETGGG